MRNTFLLALVIPFISWGQVFKWNSVNTGKVGIKNSSGKILLEAKFDRIYLDESQTEGVYFVEAMIAEDSSNLYRVLNDTAELLFEYAKYIDAAYYYRDNSRIYSFFSCQDEGNLAVFNINGDKVFQFALPIDSEVNFDNLSTRHFSLSFIDKDTNTNYFVLDSESDVIYGPYVDVDSDWDNENIYAEKTHGCEYIVQNKKFTFSRYCPNQTFQLNEQYYFIAENDDHYALINQNEEILIDSIRNRIYNYEDYCFIDGEDINYIITNDEIIPFKGYRTANLSNLGNFLLVYQDEATLLNRQDKTIRLYQSIRKSPLGYILEDDEENLSLLNFKGEWIFKDKKDIGINYYGKTLAISDENAIYQLNSKGEKGKEFNRPTKSNSGVFVPTKKYGLFPNKEGYLQFFDWKGNVILNKGFDEPYLYQEGVVLLDTGDYSWSYYKLEKKKPVLISTGIDYEYEEILDNVNFIFSTEGSPYKNDFRFIIKNLDGDELMRIRSIPSFYEQNYGGFNYFVFQAENEKFGIMSSEGEVILEPKYSDYDLNGYLIEDGNLEFVGMKTDEGVYEYYNMIHWSQPVLSQKRIDFDLISEYETFYFPINYMGNIRFYDQDLNLISNNLNGIIQSSYYSDEVFVYNKDTVFMHYSDSSALEKGKFSLVNAEGKTLLPSRKWDHNLLYEYTGEDMYSFLLVSKGPRADSIFSLAYRGQTFDISKQTIYNMGSIDREFYFDGDRHSESFVAILFESGIIFYNWKGDVIYTVRKDDIKNEFELYDVYDSITGSEYLPKFELNDQWWYLDKGKLVEAD